MTFAVAVFSAAAEAPVNEFGYLDGDPKPWWEIAFPFVALGLCFALCGLAVWVVTGRLLKRGVAHWFTFAVSAFIPLFLFVILYASISIASGATSVLAIILGVARFQPEAYVILVGMILAGIMAATLRIVRHSKALTNGIQDNLDAFK